MAVGDAELSGDLRGGQRGFDVIVDVKDRFFKKQVIAVCADLDVSHRFAETDEGSPVEGLDLLRDDAGFRSVDQIGREAVGLFFADAVRADEVSERSDETDEDVFSKRRRSYPEDRRETAEK